MNAPNRIDELFDYHFDQTLNDNEWTELQGALTADPAVADRFAARARLEAELASSFGESKARDEVVQIGRNELRVKNSKRREWLWAGAVAMLGLSLTGYWLFQQRGGNDSARIEAKVLSGSLSVKGVETRIVKTNMPLRATAASELELSDGSRLKLDAGTTAVIHIPAKGERQSVELTAGKCSLNVVKAPGAFWLRTEVGSVKVLGTEFSVELRPSEKKGEVVNTGERAMKLSTVMLVAVVVGLVEVNVGGVSYSLSGGQSRAFGEEKKEGAPDKPKREGEKGDGNKSAARRKFSGEISAVSADSITLTTRGDAGPGTETAKITAATKIQVQTAEDEIRKGEGGQEKRVPKTIVGTAADLKVGERAMMGVNEAGEAVMIMQVRKPQREGGERKEGDKPAVRREGGDAPRKEGGEGDKKAPSRIGSEGAK